jgi:small subunit ribosomal protein S21
MLDPASNPPRQPCGTNQTNQEHRMRGVTMKKGEPVDRALKRLKTKLDAEGILEEMRRRRAFETPTERKQRKLRSASKRNKIRWRYSNAPAVDRSMNVE